MLFIVSQQILPLGNPANRSADSCESLGARFKKLIKNLTCRRRCRTDAEGAPVDHVHTKTRDGKKTAWTQALTKGFLQQAFGRVCVSAANLYGSKNAPYLQRSDARLLSAGRLAKGRDEVKRAPARNIRARLE